MSICLVLRVVRDNTVLKLQRILSILKIYKISKVLRVQFIIVHIYTIKEI